MGSLTIRNIDDDLKRKLKIRAARNGLSVEEDLRRALKELVAVASPRERGDAEAKVIYETLKALSQTPVEPFDHEAITDDLYDLRS